MSDTQFSHRWQERNPKPSDQKIIKALRDNRNLSKMSGLNTYFLDGIKFFDLSGITIDGEVLDVSHLSNIDLSHSRLIDVKFSSQSTLSNFRFEFAELVNVSFKCTNQSIDTRLGLENFFFKEAKIERLDFSSISFDGRNYFLDSKFYDADFSNLSFKQSIFCDFSKSKYNGCSFSGAVLDGTILCRCLFSDCDLRDTRFEETNLSDIAFKNCIVNSKTTFDKKIILERNRSSEKAYETYIQLKNLFRNTGHFLESQKYYLREVITRGKKEKIGIKKIFLMALGGGAKVCHKPWQVFVWSLTFVFFFAGIYSCVGIGNCEGYILEKDFLKCLYFSAVTFTTLGYGDLTPISGFGKFFASIEAFLGPAFAAIFISALIKKSIQE
ncbi:MAG: hypothetical protein QG657_2067 [Acidobacteriota bacterium]|nr:hypothetical protein [Acidobacteriota bacterium]